MHVKDIKAILEAGCTAFECRQCGRILYPGAVLAYIRQLEELAYPTKYMVPDAMLNRFDRGQRAGVTDDSLRIITVHDSDVPKGQAFMMHPGMVHFEGEPQEKWRAIERQYRYRLYGADDWPAPDPDTIADWCPSCQRWGCLEDSEQQLATYRAVLGPQPPIPPE